MISSNGFGGNLYMEWTKNQVLSVATLWTKDEEEARQPELQHPCSQGLNLKEKTTMQRPTTAFSMHAWSPECAGHVRGESQEPGKKEKEKKIQEDQAPVTVHETSGELHEKHYNEVRLTSPLNIVLNSKHKNQANRQQDWQESQIKHPP